MGHYTPSLVMSRKMGHFYIIPRKYGAVLFNSNKLHKILGKNRPLRNMAQGYPHLWIKCGRGIWCIYYYRYYMYYYTGDIISIPANLSFVEFILHLWHVDNLWIKFQEIFHTFVMSNKIKISGHPGKFWEILHSFVICLTFIIWRASPLLQFCQGNVPFIFSKKIWANKTKRT